MFDYTKNEIILLIDGYFRQNDKTLQKNPRDIMNMVLQYFYNEINGKYAIFSVKSNHTPKMLLLNIPINLEQKKYSNGSKSSPEVFTFSLQYLDNNCKQHNGHEYYGWSQLGILQMYTKNKANMRDSKPLMNSITPQSDLKLICDIFPFLDYDNLTFNFIFKTLEDFKLIANGFDHELQSDGKVYYESLNHFEKGKSDSNLFDGVSTGMAIGDTVDMKICDNGIVFNKNDKKVRSAQHGVCRGYCVIAVVVCGCDCVNNGGVKYKLSMEQSQNVNYQPPPSF